jgi:hypothetical protein
MAFCVGNNQRRFWIDKVPALVAWFALSRSLPKSLKKRNLINVITKLLQGFLLFASCGYLGLPD